MLPGAKSFQPSWRLRDEKVFKLCKFVFMVAFIFGGWTLAAASLHVVHAPGSMLWNKVPYNVRVVPKSNLNFKDTFVDTTKWTVADLDTRIRNSSHGCNRPIGPA